MNEKFYSVIFDDGRTFDYYLYKNKENAQRKYQELAKNFDLDDDFTRKKGIFERIEDTFNGSRLELREEKRDD